MQVKKILLIRMLSVGEVCAIGIPALRHFQRTFSEAQVDFLTFDQGADIIRLASPKTQVITMTKEQWPEHIIAAMEAFLGLAETIVEQGYDQIFNLDTGFMPCFLARFLKDAGEPVQGNKMSVSVAELIDQFQQQTLKPEYVNLPANYIDSSFTAMSRWYTPWWHGFALPDFGYPEFYLRTCCGFDQATMDCHIALEKKSPRQTSAKKVIAIAAQSPVAEQSYPHAQALQLMLTQAGFDVWQWQNSTSLEDQLVELAASDLLVAVPGDAQWLAAAVECPSLIVVGDVDPRTLMPDFATDMSTEPPSAKALCESIMSVFEEG